MTPKLMGLLALLPLLLLLLLIVVHDIRQRRIPNKLVLLGMLLGVGLNGLLPEGQGFNSVVPGGLGWIDGLKGVCVGLLVLLPMYWLEAIGAGDVKLMAMVGAFLGHEDVIGALLATFIVGGFMAIAMALWSRQMMRLLRNVQHMLLGLLVNIYSGFRPVIGKMVGNSASLGELPYALAIALGTCVYLIWQRMSGSVL